MGLTISKRLVELHGGTITAHSRGLHKGATFEVRFPTVPAPEPAASELSKLPGDDVTSLRILLVEDHDDTRKNMTRLLTAPGHDVISAADARGFAAGVGQFV